MEQKQRINTFKDLEAWKVGHTLAIAIYKTTKKYPQDEVFGIVSQMRRAAVSITSNLAGGFSRGFPKEKVQFYLIAKGSSTELLNQLLLSRDIGYISLPEYEEIELQLTQVGRLLTGLIKYQKNLTN